MLEIWGTYCTERAARRGGGRLVSGSCCVCSLYFGVILCVSVYVNVYMCLEECLCLQVHVWECTLTDCLPLSVWINVFVLWEREILDTAVHNIIQPLGFVPRDMDVHCAHPHKDMTRGKLYEFSLRFLHIYCWCTSNHMPCSPLHSDKCGTEWKTCNPISFVYYCYYWEISKCIANVLWIIELFHTQEQLHFHERGQHLESTERVRVWNGDVSVAALAEGGIIYSLFVFHISTPYFN